MRRFRQQVIPVVLAFFITATPVFAGSEAPALPETLNWINTTQPVKPSDLQNRFVLLHFGIYSASNADLTIRDLKRLQSEFGQDLVVIGIHAAKYFDSSVVDAVRTSLAEQKISYPVAIDKNLTAWKAFNIFMLPSVVLISPTGEVLLRKTGAEVEPYAAYAIKKRKKDGVSSRAPAGIETITPFNPTGTSDEKRDSSSLTAEKSLIDVTKEASEPLQPSFADLNFQNFVGDRIQVNREYSRHVNSIRVTLIMPQGTHLFKPLKSYVRVYTNEGEYLGGLETPYPSVEIPIHETIDSKRLYVEAVFYFNRARGWTEYRGLLYEIPLSDYSKSETITLTSNVSNP